MWARRAARSARFATFIRRLTPGKSTWSFGRRTIGRSVDFALPIIALVACKGVKATSRKEERRGGRYLSRWKVDAMYA